MITNSIALDTRQIRVKKIFDLPAERNEQRVENGRREYIEWFVVGRAAAGERPMGRARGRSPNLNLILAVSEHVGIVHVYCELTRQTVIAERFLHFLDNLEAILS